MNGSMAGSTTAYPSGLAVAATFEPEMARLWGSSMGAEFAGKVLIGPVNCMFGEEFI